MIQANLLQEVLSLFYTIYTCTFHRTFTHALHQWLQCWSTLCNGLYTPLHRQEIQCSPSPCWSQLPTPWRRFPASPPPPGQLEESPPCWCTTLDQPFLLNGSSVCIHLPPTGDHRWEILHLLIQFPILMWPTFDSTIPTHSVFHHVEMQGPPEYTRPCRLAPDKLHATWCEFQAMMDMGIIGPFSSPWALPLHMVPKFSGEWCSCGNFFHLNIITILDRYPIPYIQDFFASLSIAKIFSNMDLIRGYHQIPVHFNGISKSAISTSFGLFKFVCMPFGLRNATLGC